MGLCKREEGDWLETGGELVIDVDRVGCEDGGEGPGEWDGKGEGVSAGGEGAGWLFGVCCEDGYSVVE